MMTPEETAELGEFFAQVATTSHKSFSVEHNLKVGFGGSIWTVSLNDRVYTGLSMLEAVRKAAAAVGKITASAEGVA